MVIRHVAASFHAEIKAVSYAIFLTLAMRPVGALCSDSWPTATVGGRR